MNLLRKTVFLVTGTASGIAAVLAYNPPHLNNQILASGNSIGSTTPPSTTPTSTPTSTQSAQSKSTQTPAQPNSKQTVPAQKTQVQSSQSSSSSSSTNSQPSATQTQAADTTQSSTTQPSSKSGTFVGDTSQTRWGPVQVQITVSAGKITDVQALQYPNGDGHSMQISSAMIPWLIQETLKVQSTNIMNISGATITGNGWKRSLASALQKAGL